MPNALGFMSCIHTYSHAPSHLLQLVQNGFLFYADSCGGRFCKAKMDGTCLLDAGVSPPRDEPLLFWQK